VKKQVEPDSGVIVVKNLVKKFDTELVLDGISLAAEEGKATVIDRAERVRQDCLDEAHDCAGKAQFGRGVFQRPAHRRPRRARTCKGAYAIMVSYSRVGRFLTA